MIAVYDTETTGLTLHPDAPLEKQPRMIEFGGVLLDESNGEVAAEISLLIDPCSEISDEITKITGITRDMVIGAPKFTEALPQIREFFARADTVMAHNLPFDKAIVFGELRRAGAQDNFPWPKKEICTVGAYRAMWGKNPKLIDLYAAVMNRPLAQTHRALDDVRALVEIVKADQLWTL